MFNKLLPFQGLTLRIPILIPIKRRGIIFLRDLAGGPRVRHVQNQAQSLDHLVLMPQRQESGGLFTFSVPAVARETPRVNPDASSTISPRRKRSLHLGFRRLFRAETSAFKVFKTNLITCQLQARTALYQEHVTAGVGLCEFGFWVIGLRV